MVNIMKNKYQRLSKEEQKNAKEEYIKRNPLVYKRFHKLSNVCILGIIYALLVLVFDLVFSKTLLSGSFTLNIIIDSFVLIFCLTFYFFSKDTINRQINKMLVEDLRNKQKAKWERELKDLEEIENKETKTKKVKSKKTTSKKTTKKSNSKITKKTTKNKE